MQGIAAVKRHRERAVLARAVERLHRHRDHDFRAELLCLVEGARGQGLAGNAGRKAQIVFDARAGAGLAAEGAGVEHGDGEAFGRGIHGRGEPGWPRADDRDVVDTVVARTADHADRARKLGFAGIAQHRTIGCDDQRPVVRLGRITRDDVGGVAIARGIEQMMRLAVAGEEALQPHHACRMRRTDQHHAADAALEQIDPAQDQRAHDALAEFGLGDQQRAQPLRRQQQRLDIAFGAAVDQRRPSGELAQLRPKLPGPDRSTA